MPRTHSTIRKVDGTQEKDAPPDMGELWDFALDQLDDGDVMALFPTDMPPVAG